jgi:DNA-binding NtrC family response regulator
MILEPAGQYGFESAFAEFSGLDPDRVRESFEKTRPNVIVVCASGDDLAFPTKVLDLMQQGAWDVPVLLVIESYETHSLRAFFELDAADFILAPLRPHDVLARIARVHRHIRSRESMIYQLKEELGLKQFVGESPGLIAEMQKVPKAARCDVSVLISGETGTGKEMIARAIHYVSDRSGKPFVPVNCGAMPGELIENELFGHQRGAFTSATTSCEGLVFQADHGTLFLDELECLPLRAQATLLRFLQEHEYRALGSRETRKADVRVIAATNSDCLEAVKAGQLRRDLFYRLNVIPIMLPPLRERTGDIPLLARYFLRKYALQFNKRIIDISPVALRMLLAHDWPGNVRELEHLIERAVALTDDSILQKQHIHLPASGKPAGAESFRAAKAHVVAQFERNYIDTLLRAHSGNISHAAQTAQKNRRAFWQLMRKHEIAAAGYKAA